MRDLLIHMAEAERRLRSQLAASREALAGIPPELRALHEANARELELIIDDDGWPTLAEAGEEGVEAAFLIVLHAVSRPAFQRRCLALMRAAAARGDIPLRHPQALEERLKAMDALPGAVGWR